MYPVYPPEENLQPNVSSYESAKGGVFYPLKTNFFFFFFWAITLEVVLKSSTTVSFLLWTSPHWFGKCSDGSNLGEMFIFLQWTERKKYYLFIFLSLEILGDKKCAYFYDDRFIPPQADNSMLKGFIHFWEMKHTIFSWQI